MGKQADHLSVHMMWRRM
uniref:Uncharacterized protein n=1 Tax=Rhizophora mucronata TaxID=61149 RepID=A0A2P2P7K5_RHIMU